MAVGEHRGALGQQTHLPPSLPPLDSWNSATWRGSDAHQVAAFCVPGEETAAHGGGAAGYAQPVVLSPDLRCRPARASLLDSCDTCRDIS